MGEWVWHDGGGGGVGCGAHAVSGCGCGTMPMRCLCLVAARACCHNVHALVLALIAGLPLAMTRGPSGELCAATTAATTTTDATPTTDGDAWLVLTLPPSPPHPSQPTSCSRFGTPPASMHPRLSSSSRDRSSSRSSSRSQPSCVRWPRWQHTTRTLMPWTSPPTMPCCARPARTALPRWVGAGGRVGGMCWCV